MGFVRLVLLVPKGGARRVEGDRHMGGLQLLEHAEQRVRESVDGAHGLARPAHRQGLVAQGVIGTVDDAVTVQDHQPGLPFISHCAAIIASRLGACASGCRARDGTQTRAQRTEDGTMPCSREHFAPFRDLSMIIQKPILLEHVGSPAATVQAQGLHPVTAIHATAPGAPT